MTTGYAVACKILSILLHYPDRELWTRLAEIEAEIQRLPESCIRRELSSALAVMRQCSLMALQQTYTAVFDMKPETTLNMTYHRYGDSEKRAAALVRLRQSYAQAGYACTTAELPDYLPLMLEFLSEDPDTSAAAVVWESLCDVERLSENLQADAPVYAGLMKALNEIRKEMG